ncbi:hypothetical protein [Halapricum desulfuricans]|uniref:hypothetical protein n=1 Tax=Halapricum desulfuricans TaxID=2841257 RepID=UPI001E294C25|nr:hypothetical protein [Halapricum desulfuricans]
MVAKIDYQVPWFSGLILGVISFGMTFMLIHEFVSYGYQWTTMVDLESWQIDSWFVFSAHHVPVSQTASSGSETMAIGDNMNLIKESRSQFNFLYLIPPIPTFIGGLLLADSVGGKHSAGYSFLNGAFIAIGYLVTSIGLAWFSAESTSGLGVSMRIGPSLVESFLVAGLAYPIVFGGLGGLAHYVVRNLS